MRKILLLIILFGQLQFLAAQSFGVGSQNDQLLRMISLQDSSKVKHSLMIRPIQPDALQGSNPILNHWVQANKILVKRNLFTVSALPLDWVNQLNTHHPYGWNDGSMIGAKGYQTLVRTGIQFQSKFLDIQLAPEVVHANNAPYPTNANFGPNSFSAFNKIYAGQSHGKVKLGKIGMGISTENLWWGPGIRSSLLMSNNAPGFQHWTFHTNSPIKTKIGAFSWQLIGAKLISINQPYDNFFYQDLPVGSPVDRYLSAYTINYQPSFIQGLTFGFTRVLQQQFSVNLDKSRSFWSRFLPVINNPVQKKNAGGEDTANRDQIASLQLRWVFPKAGFEFYGEYGFNDYKLNVRDYMLNIPHSAAYMVGFKKVFQASKEIVYDVGFEATQMSQSPDQLVRWAGSWYRHWQLHEGYTYMNQTIGVGAGYGTNLQSLYVNRYRKKEIWGISLDHLNRDPDTRTTLWNDWVIGIQHKRRYEKLFLDAQLQLVNSNNYAWEQGRNTVNLFARLGLTYLW